MLNFLPGTKMENIEEIAVVNSELRFLTIELMKIAAKQNRSFDEVLSEYFSNAYKLKRRLLLSYPRTYSFRKKKRK